MGGQKKEEARGTVKVGMKWEERCMGKERESWEGVIAQLGMCKGREIDVHGRETEKKREGEKGNG